MYTLHNIITHNIYLYIYNANMQILIKEMEGMEGGKICYNLQELEQRAIALVYRQVVTMVQHLLFL